MPLTPSILSAVTSQPPASAWAAVADHLRDTFFAVIPNNGAENEVVGRDRSLAELDNVLSGSAWDLWRALRDQLAQNEPGDHRLLDRYHQRQGGPHPRRSVVAGSTVVIGTGAAAEATSCIAPRSVGPNFRARQLRLPGALGSPNARLWRTTGPVALTS